MKQINVEYYPETLLSQVWPNVSDNNQSQGLIIEYTIKYTFYHS